MCIFTNILKKLYTTYIPSDLCEFYNIPKNLWILLFFCLYDEANDLNLRKHKLMRIRELMRNKHTAFSFEFISLIFTETTVFILFYSEWSPKFYNNHKGNFFPCSHNVLIRTYMYSLRQGLFLLHALGGVHVESQCQLFQLSALLN